jgi:23S rRNA (guanosine2251-2'-O)-methyltransferase
MAKAPHIKDAVFYLQACGIQVVAATEKARDSVFDTDLCKGTAIIMGSEGKGVSPAVLKAADTTARLPIVGSIASLNVSVACGVFLYEVVRQRTSQ